MDDTCHSQTLLYARYQRLSTRLHVPLSLLPLVPIPGSVSVHLATNRVCQLLAFHVCTLFPHSRACYQQKLHFLNHSFRPLALQTQLSLITCLPSAHALISGRLESCATHSPSVHPSFHPSVHPSIHPFLHPCSQPSLPPSVCPSLQSASSQLSVCASFFHFPLQPAELCDKGLSLASTFNSLENQAVLGSQVCLWLRS